MPLFWDMKAVSISHRSNKKSQWSIMVIAEEKRSQRTSKHYPGNIIKVLWSFKSEPVGAENCTEITHCSQLFWKKHHPKTINMFQSCSGGSRKFILRRANARNNKFTSLCFQQSFRTAANCWNSLRHKCSVFGSGLPKWFEHALKTVTFIFQKIHENYPPHKVIVRTNGD